MKRKKRVSITQLLQEAFEREIASAPTQHSLKTEQDAHSWEITQLLEQEALSPALVKLLSTPYGALITKFVLRAAGVRPGQWKRWLEGEAYPFEIAALKCIMSEHPQLAALFAQVLPSGNTPSE